MIDPPMINSEGVTWYHLDGRIYRVEVSLDGKARALPVLSWSADEAPTTAEALALVSDPESVGSLAVRARAMVGVLP